MTVLGAEPVVLWGQRNSNHWLTIRLQGTRSNRDGQGAQVAANGQWQTASTAGSYVSASDQRIHFGLGSATKASVQVTWPSGTRQELPDVRVDQFLTVKEPEK